MSSLAIHSGAASIPRSVRPVVHYDGSRSEVGTLPVICESEVRLVVNGEPLATLLCSDAALRELVYGFLYDEEVVDGAGEIRSFSFDETSRTAQVAVARVVDQPECPVRSSGFAGVALKAPSDPLRRTAAPRADATLRYAGQVGAPAAVAAVRLMQDGATEYASTRGMHCSALFDGQRMVAHFEDVGRHNTLDKLAGFCLLEEFESDRLPHRHDGEGERRDDAQGDQAGRLCGRLALGPDRRRGRAGGRGGRRAVRVCAQRERNPVRRVRRARGRVGGSAVRRRGDAQARLTLWKFTWTSEQAPLLSRSAPVMRIDL